MISARALQPALDLRDPPVEIVELTASSDTAALAAGTKGPAQPDLRAARAGPA